MDNVPDTAQIVTWTWNDDFDYGRQSGEHRAAGPCASCCNQHGYPKSCECGGTLHAEGADLSNDPEASTYVHVVFCDREQEYQFS